MPRIASLTAWVVVTALLTACGFQPVHAPQGSGLAPETAATSQVRVQPIPDRLGQLLHRQLTERLHGGGGGAPTIYRVSVQLDERVTETGFRSDETATRRNITLTAAYRMVDIRSNKLVLNGRAQSTNSANVLDQPFATNVAEDDARKRGAGDLAEKIFRDIASKLSSR